MFTIEYDYDDREDTMRNSLDEEVLAVQYNDAGQVISLIPPTHIDAMKIMHDSLGRPNQIVWGDSTIIFEYDRLNRITFVSAVVGRTSYLER